jgi:hypothetical protein
VGIPELSAQANVAEGCGEENANVGRGLLVGPVGPDSIDATGAWVSTTKLLDAGVGSAIPAPSRART